MPAALTLMTSNENDPANRHSQALHLLTATATFNSAVAPTISSPTTNVATIKLLEGDYTLLDLTRVPLALVLPTTTRPSYLVTNLPAGYILSGVTLCTPRVYRPRGHLSCQVSGGSTDLKVVIDELQDWR